MKVYCSRYENDTTLMDSLVGKDAWVKVKIGIYSPSREFMMRIFNRLELNQLPCYSVVYFPTTYLDEEDDRYHMPETGRWVYEEPDDRVYAEDIYVLKPIEIYTTDELFCFENI